MAKSTYHRDDLKRELLDSGRRFVAENGHEKLTITALAKAVGVSSGAPYHHFASRRDLLVDLACEGFQELAGGAQDVVEAYGSKQDRLNYLARAFLNFANENPRLFTLMFESELTRPTVEPRVADARRVGFVIIRDVLLDGKPAPDAMDTARIITFWSTLFGFARLWIDSLLDEEMLAGLSFEDLKESVAASAVQWPLAAQQD